MNYRQAVEKDRNPELPDLIAREIERRVAEAKALNRTLHAGMEAQRIAELFPQTELAHDDLRDEILAHALAARAPTALNSAI